MNKKLVLAGILLAVIIAIPAITQAAALKAKGQKLAFGNKAVTADQQKVWSDKQAIETAKQTAIIAAMDAGNYDAWVAAVGPNCPMLQKINKDNFSKYLEIYNLEKQIKVKKTELGLEQGAGLGKAGGCPMAKAGGCGMKAGNINKGSGGCGMGNFAK